MLDRRPAHHGGGLANAGTRLQQCEVVAVALGAAQGPGDDGLDQLLQPVIGTRVQQIEAGAVDEHRVVDDLDVEGAESVDEERHQVRGENVEGVPAVVARRVQGELVVELAPERELLVPGQIDRQVRGPNPEDAVVVGLRVEQQMGQPAVEGDHDVAPAVDPGVIAVLAGDRVAVVADLDPAAGGGREPAFGGPVGSGVEDDARVADLLVVAVAQPVGRSEPGDPVRRLPPGSGNAQATDDLHDAEERNQHTEQDQAEEADDHEVQRERRLEGELPHSPNQ